MSDRKDTKNEGEPRPLIPLAEAAELTGRDPEAIRAMIRRGKLQARKGNDGRWLVELPQWMTAMAEAMGVGEGEAGAKRWWSEETDRLHQAMDRLVRWTTEEDANVAALHERGDRLDDRIGQLEDRVDQARERLEERLERAEQERAELARQHAETQRQLAEMRKMVADLQRRSRRR